MDSTKYPLLSVMCVSLLLLVSCAEDNFTYVDVQTGYDAQTYTIDENADPNKMQTFEHTEQFLTDAEKQALFEQQQQQREAIDEYQVRTKAWKTEEETFEAEERRLEAYCNEEGYTYCNTLTYTCLEEHECNKVQLACEDSGFDRERFLRTLSRKYDCNDWEITVLKDDFNYNEIDLVDFSDAGMVE